jgi:hypothetical protein
MKPLPPGIHAILGDSAAGIFTRVFDGARELLLIDQDVLSVGPTRSCASWTEWQRMRFNWWNALVPDTIGDHVHSPMNLVDNATRLKDAERIHIWAATGVTEQLFIALLLHLADEQDIDPDRISLRLYEGLPGRRQRIVGMGELNEANLSNEPAPLTLSAQIIDDYQSAWAALTSSDPSLLEGFGDSYPLAKRWLREAMDKMLRRYPTRQNGLTYWDFQLLRATRLHAPRAARIIGHAMTEDFFDGDLTGEWYLFGRLLRLGDSRLPEPLLKLTGDTRDLRNTEAALTPFGEAVLDGRKSSYPVNPIDDWAGGVHLSSVTGDVWLNDNGRLVRHSAV